MNAKDLDKRKKTLLDIISQKHLNENIVILPPERELSKFIGYSTIYEDLKLCDKLCNKLHDEKDDIISASLVYSIIAIYGRCFSDASQSSFPKLEESEINEEFKVIHKYLHDLRNIFIAHRGKSESEMGIGYILVPFEKGPPIFKYSGVKRNRFKKDEITKIQGLINFLLDLVEIKRQKIVDKLYSRFIDEMEPSELLKFAINKKNT